MCYMGEGVALKIFLRVDLDYNEEVYRSIKDFNPKQGYLKQILVSIQEA